MCFLNARTIIYFGLNVTRFHPLSQHVHWVTGLTYKTSSTKGSVGFLNSSLSVVYSNFWIMRYFNPFKRAGRQLPSWSRLDCQVHLSRRKIRPTSTKTKITESGLLRDSRYEHDWLSHRFFHNLKSHSNGLNYKTKPFAEVYGSLMSRIERKYKFYNFS